MVLKRLTTLSQLESNALVKDVADGAFIRDGGSLIQLFTILTEKAAPGRFRRKRLWEQKNRIIDQFIYQFYVCGSVNSALVSEDYHLKYSHRKAIL